MHNLLITTNLYCHREGKNYGSNQQIIITKILGKIKEVEGEKLNYTDFLYNSPDILYKLLIRSI